MIFFGKPVSTFPDHALDRNANSRAQSPERRVAQRDIAAVGARDIACDGEPEAGAAFILVARIVEPQERPAVVG